jgi:hypothetical protein
MNYTCVHVQQYQIAAIESHAIVDICMFAPYLS